MSCDLRRTVSVIKKNDSNNTTIIHRQKQQGWSTQVDDGNDDEEWRNENGRRPRTVYSKAQVKELEKIFHINHYVDLETRKLLSKKIDLQEDRIQVSWR